MERKAARTFTNLVLPRLLWALGLNRWDVRVEWRKLPAGRSAHVSVDFDYERADLQIDAAALADEEALLRTLRHECFHILHGGFCELLGHARILATTDAEREMVESAYQLGAERLIKSLEWLFDQHLGLEPEAMLERSREHDRARVPSATMTPSGP